MCPIADLHSLLCIIDEKMVDPLSAKFGEFDINDPANMNGNTERQDESNSENFQYVPAVTKEILE